MCVCVCVCCAHACDTQVEEEADDPNDFSDDKVVARLVKMMRCVCVFRCACLYVCGYVFMYIFVCVCVCVCVCNTRHTQGGHTTDETGADKDK